MDIEAGIEMLAVVPEGATEEPLIEESVWERYGPCESGV